MGPLDFAHGSAAGFERHLGRMDAATPPEQIRSELESTGDTAAEKRAELAQAKKKRRALTEAARDRGDIKGVGMGAGIFDRDNNFLGNHQNDQVGGDPKAVEAIMHTKEQIEQLTEDIEQAENRAAALGDKLADSSAYAAAKEEEKKLTEEEEKRLALAEKIGKEIETPYEKAKEKQAELDKALERGVITSDVYDRASTKNQ